MSDAWYNSALVINGVCRPGTVSITPPPSTPLWHQSLGDHWASYLAAEVKFPIFVTIQPNTASGAPLRVRTAPGSNSPEDRLSAFTSKLLYDLDKTISGCPKPGLLGPRDRLQGYVIFEGLESNAHPHILISCRDRFEQFWTALRLFELLDTVPHRRKDQDDEWQRETWELLVWKGWLTEVGRTRTFSPLLHRLAPGATATVQPARETVPGRSVFGYVTKELGRATLALATETRYWADRADFHVRQLCEFHSRAGYEVPASRIRKDPLTNALTLDLDDPNPWKRKGKRICHQ
jgi:hypothetical protein